jgi:TrmH family RNA methyltransferase
MIESTKNEKLKSVRALHDKKRRVETGLFTAEGEDLVAAALGAGWEPQAVFVTSEAPDELRAHSEAVEVATAALASASALGSGTRVIGVFEQRWSKPAGDLSVYLDGVGDPGNIGTVLRSALAFGDGPVVLGPGCADPYSPKAVRASMGALFARPPARGGIDQLAGATIALDMDASDELESVSVAPPLTVCVGSERDGLSAATVAGASLKARLAMRPGGPESVNAAVAASIALYTLAKRFKQLTGE